MKIVFVVYYGERECGGFMQKLFTNPVSAQKYLDELGLEKQEEGEEDIKSGTIFEDLKDHYIWERKEDGSWSDKANSESLFMKDIELHE